MIFYLIFAKFVQTINNFKKNFDGKIVVPCMSEERITKIEDLKKSQNKIPVSINEKTFGTLNRLGEFNLKREKNKNISETNFQTKIDEDEQEL